MSPRNACGWPEWEEKSLLSWLYAHRDLSWKALSDAYYEEYQVDRSVESLREKKYHILRKQRCTGAKVSGRSGKQKPPGGMRRSLVNSDSRSPLPDNNSAQRNIDKWFQKVLAADPSQSGVSDKPAQTTRSEKCRVVPAPLPYPPKRTRSSSWMWDYVHLILSVRDMNHSMDFVEQGTITLILDYNNSEEVPRSKVNIRA
ncbi:hypothetical protein PCH_Pc22g27160 [Penicillium rubens Wisconsin 54-1255]|uniref:Uncharacterized protein n=1 Tax=Penicillium rubens (strain ATCC 28089 / DSM 1075 / NRRL 1951 / Wisconsin 54-1255) TaxID=500485 RepID=B6HUS3_PENRW|nr:hypothetical protein PCH_Pc22g27160 [Penicillium rubens Wisconsin 54-1255]